MAKTIANTSSTLCLGQNSTEVAHNIIQIGSYVLKSWQSNTVAPFLVILYINLWRKSGIQYRPNLKLIF